MVFRWGLNDRKFSQISQTLLNFVADLTIALVWMVSILPPISNCSIPLSETRETVPSTPITIGIVIIALIFHRFLSSQARSKYFSFVSLFLILTLWHTGMAKSTMQYLDAN